MEQQYLDLLYDVMKNGDYRKDRTGVGAMSVFGRQLRFDLTQGFPLLTTKRVHFKSVAVELLWMLSGSTNVKWLQENGCTIWDEWADEKGDLGPVYGRQWRSWRGQAVVSTPQSNKDLDGIAYTPALVGFQAIDQIAKLIEGLKANPFGRRHLVSAWNPAEIDDMALPPCHCLFQFFVREDHTTGVRTLDCQLYQRSADIFLGVPFNIASYALLTKMIAQVVGMRAGHFVHSFGDLHLYANHVEQARTQLDRPPLAAPRVILNPAIRDIDKFTREDISLVGYHPHPPITAAVAV